MRKRSKILEDTALWKVYKERMNSDMDRIGWLKKVYQTSADYLKDVRQIFKNYTLHDEIHILNVLDAMGGLLGDCVENLTDGELELLILAASLHDIGMVYTEEEIIFCLEDEAACKAFLRENCPEMLGCEPEHWPEDIRQWYLRTRHPFRISEVLQNTEWKNLFEECPLEIVSKRCILAVCQAHGEQPEELCTNPYLKYQAASETDPLFCALLLRLADLLDFDDTRAPRVLYSYVANNEKSRAEWDKHQASAGFRYPASPSAKELPYKARCKNPDIEHAVRKFLDWVDDELDNCARLQRYCHAPWQKEFPFPRAVLRSEIESDGYMSGDFCLTMDQEKVLKLLMGENLYDNRDVFVRELLQNAVDATLLRSEMDSDFVLEDARIDIWEWSDSEGNFWFRIDDQGTGMTLGMLQRYFLKVGNSYYTSQELKRDLLDRGKKDDFYGISRFGIGFLSCFLCGDYAEVSTLYFDPQKNWREEPYQSNMQTVHYGLRLQVTGFSGYYMLKNQAEGHMAESPLPIPSFFDVGKQTGVERHGYRIKPGTSIVIRMVPGKLGALDLRGSVKKYLCGAKMPVYYNGKRIGRTYSEAMQIIHEMAGEKTYELDWETKKRFDECFPAMRGNYPKLVQTVIPLDTDENKILDGISGAIVKHHICFEQNPRWTGKDQDYEIITEFRCSENIYKVCFSSENMSAELLCKSKKMNPIKWEDLKLDYGLDKVEALGKKLDIFTTCPQTAEQLGDEWTLFSEDMNLSLVWAAYVDNFHKKNLMFDVKNYSCLSLDSIFESLHITEVAYVYKGIVAEQSVVQKHSIGKYVTSVFLVDGEWKFAVAVSRAKITRLPLKLLTAISAILNKNELGQDSGIDKLMKMDRITLVEWRNVRESSVGQWIDKNPNEIMRWIMYKFQKRCDLQPLGFHYLNHVLGQYTLAYLQDHYFMSINYEEGQILVFHEKQKEEFEYVYDQFPPMMFCKAASAKSRNYICHKNVVFRRGITMDHPFISWLLENGIELKLYFERQFQQLIEYFCQRDAEDIIYIYNVIREQICSMSNRYGLDIKDMPQIAMNDFWTDEHENK